MSQGSTGIEASSTQELKHPYSAEAERKRRQRDIPEFRFPDSADNTEEPPKEERLERARRFMEESEPIDITIDSGELVKIDNDLIIERTKQGFTAYVITDEW